MTDGVSLRAQMDAETAKALLLLNGGGAIALLTLFANVMGKPCAEPLIPAILFGVTLMMIGLVLGVMHNRYRRYCSLHYQAHNYQPPKGRFLRLTLPEPGICFCGTICLWLSLACFLLAGGGVTYRGIANIDQLKKIGACAQ